MGNQSPGFQQGVFRLDWDICLQDAGPAFPVTLSQEEGDGVRGQGCPLPSPDSLEGGILPGALLGLFSGQRDGWVDTEG